MALLHIDELAVGMVLVRNMICFDIMMPDIDGQQVLKKIRVLEGLENHHG